MNIATGPATPFNRNNMLEYFIKVCPVVFGTTRVFCIQHNLEKFAYDRTSWDNYDAILQE